MQMAGATTMRSVLPLLLLLPLVFAAGNAAASHSHPSCPATPPDAGNTLQVSHAFGPCSPLGPDGTASSWAGFLSEQASRDASRLLYLDSLAAVAGHRRAYAPIASGRQLVQTPTYVVRARLGTPPQPLLLALDTSTDAAWIPCAGCTGCQPSSSSSSSTPTTPPFNPAASATYRPVPCGSPLCSQAPNAACTAKSCGFSLTYADSTLQAELSQDSLAVAGDTPVRAYTFGCMKKTVTSTGTGTGTAPLPQGLLGLGRGALSFLTQTRDVYQSTFSYCLPSYKSLNFSGTLRLGPTGQPKRIKTTPLLASPHRPSLYYVNMTAIRVGSKKVVPIPTPFDAATGAGTVLDSGTMFTRLVGPVYAAVRDEVRRRVGKPVSSLGGFDTCFNATDVVWPPVTLVFDGGAMQVTLPEENVVIHSTYGTISCLAVAAAPEGGVNDVLNVVASMQQQNHRVLFDVPNGRVGIARERCTAAA